MKTLLIAADFSANARHAAEYGYQFAQQVKADVILFNAFMIPVEMPQASIGMWPMYEYDEITRSCDEDLDALKQHLEVLNNSGFKPEIRCIVEPGMLPEAIEDVLATQEISLVVMGTHNRSGLSGLVLGNHARRMIDNTLHPLLLVPPHAKSRPIKKIAFASDHQNLDDDLRSIYALIDMAKLINAEILLSFVLKAQGNSPVFEKYLRKLLLDLGNKANFPHIYYRVIWDSNAENGLDWLCDHGQIDMLAMVHKPHSFFDRLIKGSHTQKMAGHISIPLLVFPGKA